MATGDPKYIFSDPNDWSNSYIYSSATTSAWNSTLSSSGSWTNFFPTPQKTRVTKSLIEDAILTVQAELDRVNQRFSIFDAHYSLCEVLANKLLFLRLPKGCAEFGLSEPLKKIGWPDDRRNTFLIVTTDEHSANPETMDMIPDVYVVDICAAQHGGICLQRNDNLLQQPWKAEVTYKSPTSLTKRLYKEGCHQPKDINLKDAIALSTKYSVNSLKPTELEMHQVNPADSEGKKFLEKFGKEVGFRTNLAQLLLDPDPIIAEKALSIAQLLLAR